MGSVPTRMRRLGPLSREGGGRAPGNGPAPWQEDVGDLIAVASESGICSWRTPKAGVAGRGPGPGQSAWTALQRRGWSKCSWSAATGVAKRLAVAPHRPGRNRGTLWAAIESPENGGPHRDGQGIGRRDLSPTGMPQVPRWAALNGASSAMPTPPRPRLPAAGRRSTRSPATRSRFVL